MIMDCATVYDNAVPTVIVPAFPNVNVEEEVVLYLSPAIPELPLVPEVPDVIFQLLLAARLYVIPSMVNVLS